MRGQREGQLSIVVSPGGSFFGEKVNTKLFALQTDLKLRLFRACRVSRFICSNVKSIGFSTFRLALFESLPNTEAGYKGPFQPKFRPQIFSVINRLIFS